MSVTVERAVELIRENSPGSIDRALALLQNKVYSFSMKVYGHPQDAEDTMQDVLLKSVPYLAKFDSSQALTVWLYKVARNRCISSHKHDIPVRSRSLSWKRFLRSSTLRTPNCGVALLREANDRYRAMTSKRLRKRSSMSSVADLTTTRAVWLDKIARRHSSDATYVTADRPLFRPLNESGWSQSCRIHRWQT